MSLPDWNANRTPGRKRWPYIPETDAAKWYVLAQATLLSIYVHPAVCREDEEATGLVGIIFCSLN